MEIASIALAGLNQASARFDQSARHMAAAASPDAPADTVDLSTAAVNLLAARNQFAANAKLVHIADNMERQALDLLG